MSRIRTHKTNFTAGEISVELLGRGDLRAYDNGARKLRNVFIQPTGGLVRRDGLRFVDVLPGRGRLVAFEFSTEQVYLLVFTHYRCTVYKQGTVTATFTTPWAESHLPTLYWTQSADTLLVVSPWMPPKKITRTSHTSWNLSDWSFAAVTNGRIHQPHYKYAPDYVSVTPSGTVSTISLSASHPVFDVSAVGTRYRIVNREVTITNVLTSTVAQALVHETLLNTSPTGDWSEQAWSPRRGYPVSVCFHQDRLVVGGSRDLPNRLWLSKSSNLFNFDVGTGLDDEAIEFPLLSDQVNAIRHVFSGRHLQVLTSGAEWMVTGDPLTPTSIQLFRQTRIGSPIDRNVPVQDVDGATVFVPRTGPQLREFLFTDTEQAYQASDLAMLSHHLIDRPVDMDFDLSRRLLHLVMSNGTMATLTVYREEQVSAWTLQQTAGAFLSIATAGDETYVMVERDVGVVLEALDPTLCVDSGLSGTSAVAKTVWTGAGHLEGQVVKVAADGAEVGDATVVGGVVTLEQPARSVQIGLAFTHVVEPLPPAVAAAGAQGASRMRPITLSFRLLQTGALYLDLGRGPSPVTFTRFGEGVLDAPPQPFSGDKVVRTLGWRSVGIEPLWRIEQSTPLPFTLLAVTTELSIIG